MEDPPSPRLEGSVDEEYGDGFSHVLADLSASSTKEVQDLLIWRRPPFMDRDVSRPLPMLERSIAVVEPEKSILHDVLKQSSLIQKSPQIYQSHHEELRPRRPSEHTAGQ